MTLFRIFHTKIATFEQCRKKYWFRYLSGYPKPPDIVAGPGVIGTGVHRAMKALCLTGRPEDGLNVLTSYLKMPVHECAGPGTEYHALALQLYEAGCDAHASLSAADTWAELDASARWPSGGIEVTARIDRAEHVEGDRWRLIDWKTGRRDMDDVTDAQLDIGHVALRKARDLPREAEVTAIGWNLRTGDKRVRVLNRDDARGTIAYLSAAATRMQATTAFEATPSVACHFCEWRPQCEEADRAESGFDDWDEED
ncbi:MAG: PD-(D/E)XK nuclease family protein [Chloroflexi bacterium]|nr:PD-(D/E)XK nuclease family protein [Chloroflexota bacterium]